MRRLLQQYLRGEGGAAALELAIFAVILAVPLMSVVDGGMFLYDRAQVDQAAQVAAQTVWSTCSTSSNIPALSGTACSALTSPSDKVLVAAQSTSLGTAVTIPSGTTGRAEGYYCVNSSGVLTLVATPPTAPPATCTSVVSGSTTAPGYYVHISTRYTYAPIFTYVSIGTILGGTLSGDAWMRVR
jgi:Flp pilus assembly protein TadG